MLECAIPKCCGHDKFLRSGTLHLADIVQKDGSVTQKMIWLCGECTKRYTVQTWRPPGEQIRPRIQSGSVWPTLSSRESPVRYAVSLDSVPFG